jgi:2-polyprenyl-6-methoxyphenol hydroxylase-like FAD-dependent oxidoreductase
MRKSNMMSATQNRRIAIVGAGPAGLTAARILQMNGCAVHVFEADASTRARDQGGTLDLHEDTGQVALQRAGLTEAFRAQARFDDQESRLIDTATAESLFEDIPAPGQDNRPEVDRKALRDLLLASLDPETVRWGSKLQEVITETDGRHRLRCADRISEPYDLVIGADGAWSKVRAALSPVTPVYTGVTFVELWIDDVDRLHPDIARVVGHGIMFALEPGKGVIAQRNGHGQVRVYAAFHAPAGWGAANGRDPVAPRLPHQHVASLVAGWSPRLRALIDRASDIAFLRPIVALPSAFRWTYWPGLTLVGDAALALRPSQCRCFRRIHGAFPSTHQAGHRHQRPPHARRIVASRRAGLHRRRREYGWEATLTNVPGAAKPADRSRRRYAPRS